MKNIEQKIVGNINQGNFFETRDCLSQLSSIKRLENILISVGCDDGSFCAHAFICFLLQLDPENIEYHRYGRSVVTVPFCHVKGAYEMSFYHTIRMSEIDVDKKGYDEALLFYNVISEKVLSSKEAREIAKKVIIDKPNSFYATQVLKQTEYLETEPADDRPEFGKQLNNSPALIKDAISSGRFDTAKPFLASTSTEELKAILLTIALDEGNLCAYSFIWLVLMEQEETAEWHLFASKILNTTLFYWIGAYQASMFHVKRAIELAPKSIKAQQALLFFNKIPEKLVNDEIAAEIAQAILQKDPQNQYVKDFLSAKTMVQS